MPDVNEMMVWALLVLQVLTFGVLLLLLAGLRALAAKLVPILQKAEGLLGGDMSALMGAVKGMKPMDLLAFGAMQVLPGIVPGLTQAANMKLAQWASGKAPPAVGAVPPVQPIAPPPPG